MLVCIATFAGMADNNYNQSGDKYPIGEVARMFGVSVATVRNWEKAGLIKAERTLGKQRRFDVSEIDRVKRERSVA